MVTIIVTLPANFRLADITCYCWLHPRRHHLATARRCHALVLWLCSFLAVVPTLRSTMYSCCCCCCCCYCCCCCCCCYYCCCCLCCSSFGRLASHLFQSLYIPLYITYSIQAPAAVALRIFLRFTNCVRRLRADAAAAASAAAAVSCHGFSQVGLPGTVKNHYLFDRLSPIIPTIIQVASVRP